MDVFFNQHNRLRAGWRILFFVLLLVGAFFVTAAIARVIPFLVPDLDADTSDIVARSLALLATAAATAVAARVTERRSFGDVGFGLRPGWWREALVGCGVGAALLVATVLPAIGWFSTTYRGISTAIVSAIVLYVVGAAFEELLCRGFLFQALADGIGPVAATVATSGLFAVLHLQNPDASLLSSTTTFAAGVIFCVAYFRTRSLWLPTGMHFAWNFCLGTLVGLPVSGLRPLEKAEILHSTLGGPEWLTGGAYGPEGGAIALVVLTIGSVLLWVVPGRRAEPESAATPA